MGNLFQELKRRKVIRVAAVYAIVAWLIIQVAGEILPTFNAPQWVNQTIVLLLMLGFPLAIVLAWALEITSEGIKADAGAASPPRSLNARMIVVKVSPLLCLAIAALLYSKIASAQGPDDSYSLIQSVYSEAGGYFMGDASDDLSLIAIAGYSNSSLGLEESNLTFFNSDGQILNRVHIGGGSWAVATTPDGAWTAVGSENEQLYLFEDTQLRWSGRPIAGNTQIRGVAISNDGRYVASGGARITIHDLTADDPIDPIFADNAETEQIRAVDIAAEGRYIAWGGRTTTSKMYMGVYDLELDEKVFVDEIEYGGEINAELRQISISPDGNRIVGGDWAGFVHYWVRNTGSDTWERVESIEVGSRVYWTDMDESGTVVIIGFQGHGPRLYELGDSSLTLLWSANEGVDGGQRSIAITPNGEYISAMTRGGGGGGGQIIVYNREGEIVFTQRSEAIPDGSIYKGTNGTDPEVWFGRVSNDGDKISFASWSGYAYFYRLESAEAGDASDSASFSLFSNVYSRTTTGDAANLTIGYARLQPNEGSITPPGSSFLRIVQGETLVSETELQALPLLHRGRFYAETIGATNMAVFITNPQDQVTSISFYFTDVDGNDFGHDSITLKANEQISALLGQSPFNGPSSLSGSFTFESSLPVSAAAARVFVNEREDFLVTMLPVSDLDNPIVGESLVFPLFIAGEGWSSQLLLVNPTDITLTGEIQFWGQGGEELVVTANDVSGSNFSYSIAPRSSQKTVVSRSESSSLTLGRIDVTPINRGDTPSGMTLLTFSNGGITITESGVENVASGNAFLLYAEVLGNFSSGDAGAVQSILAVANTSSQEASVTIELNGLDGTRVDLTGTLSVPANGETVVFLNQLSGLESLPTPFRGMVRLSSTVPISLVGIRAQWNGRADLLLTSTVPANEEKPATTAELLIPFIVDGGGWSTQFVIFSSIASTSSSGALSFFDNLGAPLALKFR